MTPLPEKAEVVIIGAGCIGASIAYHLALRGVSAVVLEKEKIPGTGSTGAAAGGVRQQFSTAINVVLSQVSVRAFERFPEEIGTDPSFIQCGYLFCLAEEKQWGSFQRQAALWSSLGVTAETLSPEQVKERVPDLVVDDLLGATFCPTDGIADPGSVTQGYFAAARERGAKFFFDTEATGIQMESDRVTAVETRDGIIRTPVVVNAAGPHAAAVGQMVHLEIPVLPYRRQCFTTQPCDWLPEDFPMVVDMKTGVYMHRESGGLLLGLADTEEPSSFHTHIDLEFRDRVFLDAFERLPKLEDAEYKTGWAGSYEVTPDNNAILGEVPGVTGFLCANGFSGHGFMQSPAVGEILAGLIVDGKSPIDVDELRFERFAKQELIVESDVI